MYTIENKKFQSADDAAQYIIDNVDLTCEYDEMLDDCYGEINVCGFNYYASDALERVDPVAYRCGYNNFLDTLGCDAVYDLERMSDGDTLTEYDFEVVYTED